VLSDDREEGAPGLTAEPHREVDQCRDRPSPGRGGPDGEIAEEGLAGPGDLPRLQPLAELRAVERLGGRPRACDGGRGRRPARRAATAK
jgi:hypothetical protein